MELAQDGYSRSEKSFSNGFRFAVLTLISLHAANTSINQAQQQPNLWRTQFEYWQETWGFVIFFSLSRAVSLQDVRTRSLPLHPHFIFNPPD
jgi:hypothetical protein